MITTLYRFYDREDVLLYVGMTWQQIGRFDQHAARKPWWGQITRATMEHFTTRSAAEAAETAAIKSEHPRFNIAHTQHATDWTWLVNQCPLLAEVETMVRRVARDYAARGGVDPYPLWYGNSDDGWLPERFARYGARGYARALAGDGAGWWPWDLERIERDVARKFPGAAYLLENSDELDAAFNEALAAARLDLPPVMETTLAFHCVYERLLGIVLAETGHA